MRYVLTGLWISLSSLAFADVDVDFSALQANALRNASTYTKDIEGINQAILASRQTGEIAHFTKTITQGVNNQEPLATHLKKVSEVIVFLSFSMPEKSLQAWLIQCKHSGATPVIRGLINNSFKETMQAIYRLSQKTGLGMQLDPVLFQTFGITQVPAVVSVKAVDACPANMNCKPPTFDRIYGDVSLDYALGKMLADHNTPANKPLETMINRIRGERA